MTDYKKHENSPYIGPKLSGLGTKLSWYARQKMFKSLMEMADITPEITVLDVGVTSDRRLDCNFFEKLYPYPHKLTAVGLEDASFLEQDYPGLTFVKTDGLRLPFPDKSFDLGVSFAVIEHVGSRDNQRAFIHELCRVSRTCFITTPNRWYPIEFHTALPLIHWLPHSWFRQILRWLGKEFWAKEANLNLLSEKNMLSLFPVDAKVRKKHFRLLGLISNLVFYIEN
ncbi:methyltransferase domain-containing protein [Limnofasciculus baicalensis]|uniref:Class I SAM-dependent methyltransferase n=1 Tax=Limnofasciculus baicalensis BBK-W-15 TaxID=2699891 RepID=A0AAE3GU30_9CYAN|nr:methyltransferase domain-containing protein [Limnofasciculus baicalensis]MCP2730359.1 class I SAM-dependent methyltransferase [Limnofasciculus baicalensis BBK-W-15]